MINLPYFPYAFALLLAIPFLIYLRQFVFNYIKLKNKEIKLITVKGNSEQRVHASERLVLFVERLQPSNLITKFNSKLAPREYIFLIEKSINEVFDYNASQQLYHTKNLWRNVVSSKNNVLSLLHSTYENLGEGATLDEFKTVFFDELYESDRFCITLCR